MKKKGLIIFVVIMIATMCMALAACQGKSGSESMLTISFETDGGTQVDDITIDLSYEGYTGLQDHNYNDDLPIPEKQGYTFLGWSANLDELYEIQCGSNHYFIPVPLANKFYSCFVNKQKKIKAYAVWTVGTENLILEKQGNEYCITGLGFADTNTINIPSSFQSDTDLTPLPITSIAEHAFSNFQYDWYRQSGYRGVVADGGQRSLKTVVIPESVTDIAYGAFCGSLLGLENLTLPFIGTKSDGTGRKGFQSIFSGFPETLQNLTLTGGVSITKDMFFVGDYEDELPLTKIVLPETVTSIEEGSFAACTSLKSITVPFVGLNGNDNVETNFSLIFGNNASAIQKSLQSITVTGGKSIPENTFSECTSLTDISLPFIGTKLDGTGNKLFKSIFGTVPKSLTTVAIAEGTDIADQAFQNCASLTCVMLPDSITTIGESAFEFCSKLKDVTIGTNVTVIKADAFAGTAITNVAIPRSLALLGLGAFGACPAIEKISVESENSFFYSEGNCLIEKTSKSIFLGCKNSVIPNGIKTIEAASFAGAIDLIDLNIPNSVESIKQSAFLGCGLKNITIPNSVTSIGELAFYNCSKLTSITIPDSVRSIGPFAFSDCSGLTSITIPDSVTSIGQRTFYNCSGLTSITIPDSVTDIGHYAFYGCSGLTSITLPDRVTSIGSNAFSDCSGLTSITIPNSITGIGHYAFLGCSGLTSVTIPDSITMIGNGVFFGCSGLTEVYYTGTSAEWDTIVIGDDNDALTSATRYYYSKTQPTESGNYWHYDADGVTVIKW